jgi:dihydroxyacetone kinase-like protein
MELGVGIHGEPGRRRVPLAPADLIAAELTAAILRELEPRKGEPLLLLVNGFGGTPLVELYLMYDAVWRKLEADGHRIARSLVGNYVTSLEMAGCSLTLARLDDELIRLWDAPVHTAALRWGM